MNFKAGESGGGIFPRENQEEKDFRRQQIKDQVSLNDFSLRNDSFYKEIPNFHSQMGNANIIGF